MFGQTNQQNSMKPVCQFYQRGNCKYGNKCWNFHPGAPRGNVFGGSSSSSSSGFVSFANGNQVPQDKEFLEFVKQVGSEMSMWEENGCWQLSCLAPLKEHPLLAGFTDTSPEELRVEAYIALKANNSAAYQASVREKLEYHKQLRQTLKNHTPEAIEVLKAVFYKSVNPTGATAPEASSSTSLFGKPSGSLFGSTPASQPSLFGGTSTNALPSSGFGASPIFGGAKPQSSTFGSSSVFGSSASSGFGGGSAFKPTFGGTGSASLFGGNPASEPNRNVFGSTTQNQVNQGGIFATPQPSSNVFGSTPTSTNSQPQTTNLFGGGTQSTATPSLFGGAPQPPASSGPFGNTSSVFGTPSAFQQQQTPANTFGAASQPTSTPSLFGNLSQPSDANKSIFGGGNTQTSSLFGNPPQTASNTGGVFGNNASTQQTSFLQNPATSNNIFGSSNFQAPNAGNNIFSGQEGTPPVSGANPPSEKTSANWGPSGSNTNSNPSPFGAPANSADGGQPSGFGNQSIFGTSDANPGQAVSGVPQSSNEKTEPPQASESSSSSIYTPLNLLTQADRQEFERDHFVNIPLVPPPRELCF